jgi:hypothetical protein
VGLFHKGFLGGSQIPRINTDVIATEAQKQGLFYKEFLGGSQITLMDTDVVATETRKKELMEFGL